MVFVKKFHEVVQLQKLQKLACALPEDVFLCSMDDTVMVDVKSFINLLTLNFSHPVKVITESDRSSPPLRRSGKSKKQHPCL